mmetsp:Transcript_13608/g.30016  ORF Transcript_13608/g.30016 Transcript_13608/m.30016 type:complete len:249 (+) Transcript_13608:340-1086(+)
MELPWCACALRSSKQSASKSSASSSFPYNDKSPPMPMPPGTADLRFLGAPLTAFLDLLCSSTKRCSLRRVNVSSASRGTSISASSPVEGGRAACMISSTCSISSEGSLWICAMSDFFSSKVRGLAAACAVSSTLFITSDSDTALRRFWISACMDCIMRRISSISAVFSTTTGADISAGAVKLALRTGPRANLAPFAGWGAGARPAAAGGLPGLPRLPPPPTESLSGLSRASMPAEKAEASERCAFSVR